MRRNSQAEVEAVHAKLTVAGAWDVYFPPEFISQVVFDAKLPEVWGFLFCLPVSLFLNNLLLSLVFLF